MDKNLTKNYYDDIYGHPSINQEKFEFTKEHILEAIGFGQINPDMTSVELKNKFEDIIKVIKKNSQ